MPCQCINEIEPKDQFSSLNPESRSYWANLKIKQDVLERQAYTAWTTKSVKRKSTATILTHVII